MQKIALGYGRFTLVDDQDATWLCLYSNFGWRMDGKGYAICKNEHIKMHVLIAQRMGLDIKKFLIDHKDRNPLNNQRSNLREATHSLNAVNRISTKNSSGFRGVFLEWNGKWKAAIRVKGTKIHLGMFNTREEASVAYNLAAKTYFGEFLPQEVNDALLPDKPELDHTLGGSKSIVL